MEPKRLKIGDRIQICPGTRCECGEVSEGRGTVIYAERSGRRLMKVKFDQSGSIHIIDPRDVAEPAQRELPGMKS